MSGATAKLSEEQRRELLRIFAAGKPLEVAGLKVTASFKLEKFDGDCEPGKEPVEVIEGGDDRPTRVTRKETADGA